MMGRAQTDLRTLEEIRQRCQRRLDVLTIPSPFDLQLFAAEIASRRGRTIRLEAVPALDHDAMGVWIECSEPPLDIVLYEARTSRHHQVHIVLHELGHMLCGHASGSHGEAMAKMLFPDLTPDAVRGAMVRNSFHSDEELEAEILATLIHERIGWGARGMSANPPRSLFLDRVLALKRR